MFFRSSCVMAVVVSAGLAAAARGGDDAARAYAAELLSDASGRTQALAAAEDKAGLKLSGNFQTRYYGNFGSDKVPAGSEDFVNGFQMRRVRLVASGQVPSTAFTYKVEGDFGKADGEFKLLEGQGEWKSESGWRFRFGQFKIPLLEEELISHNRQQAVERSTITGVFTGEYSQGVQAAYYADTFRFYGMFNDGKRTNNVDFNDSREADYGLTGRFEYKWAGEWSQVEQMTSWRESAFAGMVGGAVHWQDGGSTFGTTGGSTQDFSDLTYTLDVQVKGDGWNVFGMFVGRRTEFDALNQEFDDFGFVAQGGYFLTDQLEAFARYSVVIPDGDRSGDDLFNEVTVGVNYYFVPKSHAAKFSVDLVIAPDATTDNSLISTNTNTGILATTDSQYVLRTQLQLMF